MKQKKGQMRCIHCHRMMRVDYSYCPTCGKFVQEQNSKVSIKVLVLNFLGWLVIMLCVIFLLVYLR